MRYQLVFISSWCSSYFLDQSPHPGIPSLSFHWLVVTNDVHSCGCCSSWSDPVRSGSIYRLLATATPLPLSPLLRRLLQPRRRPWPEFWATISRLLSSSRSAGGEISGADQGSWRDPKNPPLRCPPAPLPPVEKRKRSRWLQLLARRSHRRRVLRFRIRSPSPSGRIRISTSRRLLCPCSSAWAPESLFKGLWYLSSSVKLGFCDSIGFVYVDLA